MKNLNGSVLLSSVLLSTLMPIVASASPLSSLECTAQDGSALSLKAERADTAEAILTTAQGKTSLHGTSHEVTHGVFSLLQEYDLADSAGVTSKILVSYHTPVGRGGCGRAGCPPVDGPGSHPTIQASLESGAQTTSFECESD